MSTRYEFLPYVGATLVADRDEMAEMAEDGA